jgi:hypothetical protein
MGNNSRDEIRAAAHEHGWERVDSDYSLSDEFFCDAEAPELIGRMRRAAGVEWATRNRIHVFYTEQGWVQEATLQTPQDQAVLTGNFVSCTARTKGKGRKKQILKWLARPQASSQSCGI